jgi:hypothetical protein
MENERPKLRYLLFPALISFLLSACFGSEQPRFPLASAAAPFGDGGRYVVHERVADDRYQRQEVFVIKRRPDRAYDFINETGEVLTISFHGAGEGLFAGQAKSERDKENPVYVYVMLRVAGNEVLLYAPQCDEQDKAMLATFQIEVRTQFECFIDRVADPSALFKRLAIGNPISKLVHE